MARSSFVEKTWLTEDNLKACCVFVPDSHRCGYVGVGSEHPLYGVEYQDSVDCLKGAYSEAMESEAENLRGPMISLMYAMTEEDERFSPELVFNVHGGITFSRSGAEGGYPISEDLWWFGFDCAHCDDKTLYQDGVTLQDIRSLDYVSEECEKLAKQLVLIKK